MKAYHYATYSDDPDVFEQAYYVIDNLKKNSSGSIRGNIILVVGVHNSGALVMRAIPHRREYVTGIVRNKQPREIGQGVKSSMINLIFKSTSISKIEL